MNDELPFGLWLKKRRKALDLTQSALAQRVGCSVATIEKIEAEERRPSTQIAELLANALEIPHAERAVFLRAARRLAPVQGVAAVAPMSSPRAKSNVPLPSTPLIGREAELDGIQHLLTNADCRLITLTGPGGIGKTRLAIEFALRQRDLFPDGVYYAPLASIPAPELIVPALAEAFAFSFSGPVEPRAQLFKQLARVIEKPTLLVMDNLEHLLARSTATTDLIAELLSRFSKLKILCTSRERLNLYGEWLFDLHGLPAPSPGDVDNLQAYSATALFLQAARRADAKFRLSDADKPALLEICRALDGIPLALELAAAWVGVLSCQEIARELGSNIDFLAVTMRNVPERHRSLRASFDHSWRLLSDAERATLSQLAVFQGGFDRRVAEQLAGATLPLLASLVSKSLVQRGHDGRYDLHQVIRQSALAHLAETPARALDTRDAHSAYYLRFAAAREGALKSARQQAVVQEFTRELDNVRAAWVWALERENFAALGAAGRAVCWFFEASGLVHEGIEHFEPFVRALQAQSGNPAWQRVLGQALAQQALLCFRTGHFERAQDLLEQALQTLRPLGETEGLTDALIYLAVMTHLNGDIERARTLFEEALTYAQSAGDDWSAAYAIYNLGYLASLRGDYSRGHAQMMHGLSLWRELGDPHSIALGLNYLAPTLVKLNCHDQARAYLEASLALCQQSGNRWGMGTAYRHMGFVELARRNLPEAEALFHQALETFGDYVVGWDIARTLVYLGEVKILSDDFPHAQEVLLEGLRLARAIPSVPLLLDALLDLAGLEMGASPERAYRWLTMIAAHPAATYEPRTRAAQLLQELPALDARSEPAWTLERVVQDALDAGKKDSVG